MRNTLLVGLLLVAVAIAFAASLAIGPARVPVAAIFGGPDELATIVMREIRLPRALLALLIGGSLGLSGAALQGFLRNPLAEPGVIGVSGMAGLGAVIALYGGLSASFPYALPLLAIGFALVAVALLQVLAGGASTTTLILAGVAIASLSGALTSLALNLSDNPFAVTEIVFWLLGSLADRSMVHVGLAAPFIVAGAGLLFASAPRLDALALGEEAALGMGVDLTKLRWLIVLGTALVVGAGVAVSGVVGFVGLVVPHVLRPLVGHRPAALLFVSMLGGALLLLTADIAVRLVTPGTELRLGVLTAMIGAPFFFWLVMAQRRKDL